MVIIYVLGRRGCVHCCEMRVRVGIGAVVFELVQQVARNISPFFNPGCSFNSVQHAVEISHIGHFRPVRGTETTVLLVASDNYGRRMHDSAELVVLLFNVFAFVVVPVPASQAFDDLNFIGRVTVVLDVEPRRERVNIGGIKVDFGPVIIISIIFGRVDLAAAEVAGVGV